MSLVKGFTDILNPENIFMNSHIGGGGINLIFPFSYDGNLRLKGSTGVSVTDYLYVYANGSENGCNVTNLKITRSEINREEVELRVTATVTIIGTGESIPYIGLRTTALYSGLKTLRASIKINNNVPSYTLTQSQNSIAMGLLYRNMLVPLEQGKWFDECIVADFGNNTSGVLTACWRLNDSLASHNPGDTYEVDFSIKNIAVYDGAYINAPYKSTLASSATCNLLQKDGENSGNNNMFANTPFNRIECHIPQSGSTPIYWNFMRSRGALGSVMTLKAKMYLTGYDNYSAQAYCEWDILFHASRLSSSGTPWRVWENTFTLVKSLNLGAGSVVASNFTLEYNVIEKSNTDKRIYLYIKLNQSINASNYYLIIVPEICNTTRALTGNTGWLNNMVS